MMYIAWQLAGTTQQQAVTGPEDTHAWSYSSIEDDCGALGTFSLDLLKS